MDKLSAPPKATILRLKRHPTMVGRIMEMDSLYRQPSRVELKAYARQLALVIIPPK